MGTPNTLANVDPEPLLERIASGAYVPHLAVELGCTPQGLAARLRTLDAEQYQRAREIGCELRMETAKGEMAAARDGFSLARARELFKAEAWTAEREHAHRWAAKQQVDLTVTHVDLGDRLRRAQSRVIEHEPQSVADTPKLQRSNSDKRDNLLNNDASS